MRWNRDTASTNDAAGGLFRTKYLALLVGLVTTTIGGWAWACTASGYLQPLVSPVAKVGDSVAIEGGGFSSPVEIRWNSPAGPLLARADNVQFSIPVAIPQDASPGVHFLVAIAKDSNGSVTGKAAIPIDIVGDEVNSRNFSPTVESNLWPAFGDLNTQGKVLEAAQGGPQQATAVKAAGVGLMVLSLGIVAVVSLALAFRVQTRRVPKASK